MNFDLSSIQDISEEELVGHPNPVGHLGTPGVTEPFRGQCLCCAHPQRFLLERRIVREISTQPDAQIPGAATLTEEFIDDLACEFGLSPEELLHHAEFHMSVKPGQGSLENRLNLTEATTLIDALYDGMATIDHVGHIIRDLGADRLPRVLSKEMVDLYTGTQNALRGHVDMLAKLDAQVNGTKDQTSSSLDALTAVIAASQQAALESAGVTPQTPCESETAHEQ